MKKTECPFKKPLAVVEMCYDCELKIHNCGCAVGGLWQRVGLCHCRTGKDEGKEKEERDCEAGSYHERHKADPQIEHLNIRI